MKENTEKLIIEENGLIKKKKKKRKKMIPIQTMNTENQDNQNIIQVNTKNEERKSNEGNNIENNNINISINNGLQEIPAKKKYKKKKIKKFRPEEKINRDNNINDIKGEKKPLNKEYMNKWME